MKKPVLFIFGLFTGAFLQAATSQTSGNWSEAATWTGGVFPGPGEAAVISHTVTVDVLTASAAAVTVQSGGTLRFSPNTASRLEVLAGSVTVKSNGTLEMGTAAVPIPAAYTATLVLSKPVTGVRQGLVIENGGMFVSHGAPKTPFGEALSGLVQASNAVSLPSAAGWTAGDAIVIAKTNISNQMESERRVIDTPTGAGPVTVPWSGQGNLAFDHPNADIPLLVANLTRNVVVRSSGTDVSSGGDSSYVSVLSPDFTATSTEFAFLGRPSPTANPDPWVGISVQSAGKVVISSCAVRDGDTGILISGSAASSIEGSVFYNNQGAAVGVNYTFSQTAGHVIEGNALVGSQSSGLHLENTGGALIKDNWSVDNTNGLNMFFNVAPSRVEGNRILSNRSLGISFGGPQSTFLNNEIAGAWDDGRAISAYNDGQRYVGNNIHHNRGMGLEVSGDDGVYVDNAVWSNGFGGISLRGDGNVFAGGGAGYDPSGNPGPNNNPIGVAPGHLGNFEMDGTGIGTTLVNFSIHPGMGVDAEDFDAAGTSLISFAHNGVAGETRLWGDYLLGSGQTLTLDRSQPGFAPRASTPTLMAGAGGYTAAVTAVDANAVSQLISATRSGGQWRVRESSTDAVTVHSGNTINHAQFTLVFTGAAEGDRWDFALLGGSGDAGVQKKLLMGPTASGFNGGKSRLSVAAGAGLVLRGTAAEPTLVQRLSGTGFTTFISSGAFTAEHVEVRHADLLGVQLSGNGGVTISSTVFDAFAANGAYVTARDLASVGAFHGIVFGTDQQAGTQANVRAEGSVAGLDWTFHGWSGRYSGPTYESGDTGDAHIHWALQAPASLSAVSSPGRIDLAWSHPVSPPAAYRDPYRVRASSSSSAGPWTTDTTTLLTAHPLTGLLDDTIYYVEVHTQGNAVGLSPAIGQVAVKTPDLIPPGAPQGLTGTTGAGLGEMSLIWTSPGDNVSVSTKALGTGSAFAVQYSVLDPLTVSWSTAAAVVVSTGPVAMGGSMAHTLTGLTQETTYYARAWIRDPDGNWSAVSPGTARAVPRLSPPSGVVTAPLVGAGQGIVARTAAFSVNFNRDMDPVSLQNRLTVKRVRDNGGNAVDEDVTAGGLLSGLGGSWQFQPGPLAGNSQYEVTVASGTADVQGNILGTPITARFVTAMNPLEENLWDAGAGVTVRVPAGALVRDSFVQAGAAGAQALSATEKLVAGTGDALRRPVSAAVDLGMFETSGASWTGNFARAVTVAMPYTDANGDGIVDGTQPPVRVKTLSVHWLDEARNAWVKLPSFVDPVSRRVSAATPHFTTFALIGQGDTAVADAHVFPVPYKLSAGGPLTFTNLPSAAVIEIFTVDGRLVRELSEADGDARLDWDVRDDNGETLASGLYFFRVKSGGNKKTGELLIIR